MGLMVVGKFLPIFGQPNYYTIGNFVLFIFFGLNFILIQTNFPRPVSAHEEVNSFKNGDHLNNSSSLKLVQILFRHGHREAELGTFGSGQLTNLGKRQLYELGLYLRRRYGDVHSNFVIDQAFNVNQVSIQSSSISRAVQSAQCLAYGLYKNYNLMANWSQSTDKGQDDGHDEKIPYEPITLTTAPIEQDNIFNPQFSCPRLFPIFVERLKKSFIQIAENSQIIPDAEQMDVNKNLVPTLMPIETKTQDIPTGINLNIEAFRFILGDSLSRRLTCGPLIKLLIENMDNRLLGGEMRMRLFSGHDINIQNLLIALNLDDEKRFQIAPQFGASFIMELHQSSENSEAFLEFWYRIDTKEEPIFLEIPECGRPCYLETFKKIVKDLIPTDYHQECLVAEEPVTLEMVPGLQFLLIGLTVSCCAFGVGFWLGRKKVYKRGGYTSLN